MTDGEIILDVRDLEPPEPYELATAALRKMVPGQYLRMISVRRPRLLYPWLADNGFAEKTLEVAENLFHILVWIRDDLSAAEAVNSIVLTGNSRA